MNLKFRQEDDVRSNDSYKSVELLTAAVKPGDILIDGGAHIGFISVPVIAATKPKLSLLFEPNPNLRKYLLENLEANAGDAVYRVSDKPLWNTIEPKTFIMSGAQSSLLDRQQGVEKLLEIETTTLDKELEGTTGDIVMKLDLECAEILALDGIKDNIKRLKFAIVELLPNVLEQDFQYSLAHFFDTYRALGFKITSIYGEEMTYPAVLREHKVDIVLQR